MSKSDEKEPNFLPDKSRYVQEYQKIKLRCQFQKNFSGFLLIVFFMLQYSVPIFLVVLGSVASSRDQLTIFFSSGGSSLSEKATTSASETKIASDSETTIVSKIIFLVGLITILLGVINNIVSPAQSYDTAVRYNNKFCGFEQNLDLEFLAISSFSDEASNKDTAKIIIHFLIKKNNELCQLIEEYNEARSLSPRQNRLSALDQNKNKDDFEIADNISIVKPNGKVSSSNSSTSSSIEIESPLESQQANNRITPEHIN